MIGVRTLLALFLALSADASTAPNHGALDQRIDALFQEIASAVADAPLMQAAELVQTLAATPKPVDLIILDERTDAERAVSGIPGAIALSALPDAIASAKRTLGKAPIRIVVYCTIGYRSGKRAIALNQSDPQVRASNLRGGILAWIAQGGRLIRPDGVATKKVHVYAKRWAAVPADFQATF